MIPNQFAHVERLEKPVEGREDCSRAAISKVVVALNPSSSIRLAVGPMLFKPSDRISECLIHAAEARERANAAVDRNALPPKGWVEFANRASLAKSLDVLVRAASNGADGKVRAAFYIADASGTELRHVTGMSSAYAVYVDGFKIGPQSLACGLAAATGQPILTPDVTEEPRWKEWLWLAKKFDYRACWSFPVETSEGGKIVGTFAMYHREPRIRSIFSLSDGVLRRPVELAGVKQTLHGHGPMSAYDQSGT